MATLTDVRRGLAARLRTIPNLEVYELVPAAVSLPAAIVTPTEAEVVSMGRGLVEYSLSVTVVVAGTDITDQELLDSFLHPSGASSVFAAIASDKTLGLAATNASAMSWSNYGRHTVAGTEYVGATVPVTVHTSGV